MTYVPFLTCCRNHTERDGEGVDEHAQQVNRTQRRFHLTDPRRAVHVEGKAKAREESREPECDRGAHDERVEDEEGKELSARIKPAH